MDKQILDDIIGLPNKVTSMEYLNVGLLCSLHNNTNLVNEALSMHATNILGFLAKESPHYKEVPDQLTPDLKLLYVILKIFQENEVSADRAILALIRPPVVGWLPLMVKIKDYDKFNTCQINKLEKLYSPNDNEFNLYIDKIQKHWSSIKAFYSNTPMYALLNSGQRPANKDMLPEFHELLKNSFTGFASIEELPCVTQQDKTYNIWCFGFGGQKVEFCEKPYYRDILLHLDYIWNPNKEIPNTIKTLGKTKDSQDISESLKEIYEHGFAHLRPYNGLVSKSNLFEEEFD